VGGETLAERLARTGPLAERDAYPIVEQVAGAVAAAHRVGVVHRDLKSANVMLVPAGDGEPTARAVVTDFGLAVLTAAMAPTGAGLTRSGQLLGTPAFMAPEQLEGGAVTAATDIYALGLVMYEMVTGAVPFAGESPVTLAIKRLREQPPPPRLHRTSLRAEWNDAIMRCLERDPVDRFATPDAVVAALQPGSSSARFFMPRRLRRRAMAWALAGGAAAALVGAVVAWRPDVAPNAAASGLPFNERDWVLVADFDNRTGEVVLDDTIRFALERELNTSQFVNVVPRERVADALRLMKRPEDTSLSGEVAREVSMRDGGIRALVRGRIDKLGGTYVTAVELVEPASGVVVASLAEEARAQDEILLAIRRLSNQLRTAVGEELSRIQQTHEKLVQVTTPSLRALQLYSQADAVIANRGGNRGGDATAEELLKQAIAEDPGFASAYIHLAHAIRNQGRAREEYLPHAARAMELASTVGEGEQQFIRGSSYGMSGDTQRALASYQALVQLYPDHFWGNNNAAILLIELLRGEEAIPYTARAAELRPNDFVQNRNAAWNIAVRGNAPAAARPFVDRARALMTPDLAKTLAPAAAWVEVFPSLERRVNGDVHGALQELQRLEQALATHPAAAAVTMQIAFAYEAIGRFRDAERVLATPTVSISRLMIAFLRNDSRAVNRLPKSQALGTLSQTGALGTIVLARLGLVDVARTALKRVEAESTTGPPSVQRGFGGGVPIARGELAWADRKTADTIALIEQGLPMERQIGSPVYFLGCETIANAWLKQGQANRAIAVLEDAHRQHGRTVQGSGAFWLRTVWQLAKIYRDVGRHQDAVKLEAELRQLLAVADDDHPILIEMQRAGVATPAP
jgi:tetratricopeptide (TPR) repeat protein